MKKARVLLVDDSRAIRNRIIEKLANLNLDITQAANGRDGVEKALNENYDLILTDVEMPHLDGYSLCKVVKKNTQTRSVPVVILSSHDTEKDVFRGFQVGAAAYLSKTDMDAQLCETIERLLAQSVFKRNKTIMVVDDSISIRELVTDGLRAAGFKVVVARSGKDALSKMKRGMLPDLILSDIEMPDMDGLDFCSRVHRNPQWTQIPFVVMSVHSGRALIRNMMQRGADGYIVKPFDLEQLVVTVEHFLSYQFDLLKKDRERLESERLHMLASITSMTVALEARDRYTRGHSEAVSCILTKMATVMGMSDEDMEILTIAGRLHDIGKIGVPDNILLKPGKLTYAEFEVIKKHPLIGANILESIPTLEKILPVIIHHHERIDGMGYPEGLKGKKIPLWARMTSVADTYDALTSDRPYRKGMPAEKALQIITEIQDGQLCPDCVQAFLKIMHQ